MPPSDFSAWLFTDLGPALWSVVSALGIYVALILLTRLYGLRSFSKMSSFDFAVTIAIGTVVASTLLTPDPPILRGMIALAALYGIQAAVSMLRRRSSWVRSAVDNQALLLMAGPEILYDNLKKAQITESDLMGKLREANVICRDQVRAVVMETTGDVSVLHADPDGPDLELHLLEGVLDCDRLVGLDHMVDTRDEVATSPG